MKLFFFKCIRDYRQFVTRMRKLRIKMKREKENRKISLLKISQKVKLEEFIMK